MDLETLTSQFRQRLMAAPPLRAHVLFDFGPQGKVHVDASQSPPVFDINSDATPELTLSGTVDLFANILDGKQDANFAYMTGKLKIKGPMRLAMKLNEILEG